MCSVVSLKADSTTATARNMDFNERIVGKRQAVYQNGESIKVYAATSYKVSTGVVKMICNFPLDEEEAQSDLFTSGAENGLIPQVVMQEGINGKGLGFSLLYNLDNSLGPKSDKGGDFIAFPLEMIATKSTVDEVTAAISALTGTWYNPLGTGVTCHYYFSDASGRTLVVEFHGGVPTMYSSEVGVMTNGPEYSWHLTNVRNYLNCNAEGVAKRTWNGMDFSKIGHGNGQLGIPGDMGSPSRFIRLFWNKAMLKELTKDNVVSKAAQLVGLAQTLYGTDSGPVTEMNPEDQTLWTTVKSFDGKDAKLWVRRLGDLNFGEVV